MTHDPDLVIEASTEGTTQRRPGGSSGYLPPATLPSEVCTATLVLRIQLPSTNRDLDWTATQKDGHAGCGDPQRTVDASRSKRDVCHTGQARLVILAILQCL
jgi:hypothetical protein